MLLLLTLGGGASHAVAASETATSSVAPYSCTASCVLIDTNGETVIGASVFWKGTKTGTITDIDGAFSISGVQKGDVRVISFMGFETQ